MSSNGGLIPHSRPSTSDEDLQAVAMVLRSGRLAQGEWVQQFEDAMSAFLGRRGAVATSSGTAALHLAMLTLGIGPGDEILLPSYTCTALLYAIRYVGATPRFVDINPDDYNLSVHWTQRRLSARTKAVIVPHMFGMPADVEPLISLGVPVIEDCAQSLGATYEGRPVGSFGSITVCSFYATKVITTGEGGMLLSDSEMILRRARQLRDYAEGTALEIRYNYRMTDFQAAFGLSQLRQLPSFLARRAALASLYTESLKHVAAALPKPKAGRARIFYRYVVRVTDAGHMATQLRARGIECKAPVFIPLHHHQTNQDEFPHTESAMKTALSIPLYPSLTNEEVDRILVGVKRSLDHTEEHTRVPFSSVSSAP